MSAGRSGRISDELPFLFLSLLFFFFLRKLSQSPMYYECRCVGVHKKPTTISEPTNTNSMANLTRSLRPRFFPNNNNLSELASSSHLFQTSRACMSGAVESSARNVLSCFVRPMPRGTSPRTRTIKAVHRRASPASVENSASPLQLHSSVRLSNLIWLQNR